ncbi:YtkA-like [Halobacillus alkaliphilus]|uniref:YtkA-like n=1 Tax=Halobacillus alkaliphilus TaxID=396056 RepID=A0A1I2MNW3_9BACI|nr:FixH family protein [Halobacillus alkaliphilus]SFF93132.1 YtkA-like [Halobacillus alkaliphilus]
MNRLLWSLLVFIFILLLAACGTNEQSQQNSESSSSEDQVAEVPEVEVKFGEQPIPVKEKTTIEAAVTQANEPVEDADYVDFEIWNESNGQESSKTIEAEHTGDGIYEIEYTFDSSGTYQVIAHTQVGDLHTMPQVEVVVGEEQSSTSDNSSSHSHEDSQDHNDMKEKFMVHFMKEEGFKAGEETQLTTHINQMEQPFEDGLVSFEISSDQMDKHLYVDAEEQEPGEYIASHTFPAAGSYTITIHYEKPNQDIHGHQEETIEVTE